MSADAITVPGGVPGPRTGNPVLRWSARNARIVAPLITLIVEIIFFSFASDVFLTRGNFQNVVSQVGPVAVAATGITFVLLCAEIDLSIASISVFCGIVATYIFSNDWHGLGQWGIVIAAVAGAAIGLIIGVVILNYTKLGRYVFITGGNRGAAEMSGVDTRKVLLNVMVISGFTAGMAGMLFVGRLKSANPAAGGSLLIDTI